jgi:hypothetical protein
MVALRLVLRVEGPSLEGMRAAVVRPDDLG